MPKETDLYQQLAQYMNLRHPTVAYHFDLAGVWTPSYGIRNLYGRLNVRGWPDLFIAKTALMPGTVNLYYGLFLELKQAGVRIRKVRDGTWANDHVAEQAAQLDVLQDAGFVAQFAVGYDQAVELIESYLEGTLRA